MNYKIKKTPIFLAFLAIIFFSFSFVSNSARAVCSTTDNTHYCLLAPLPGLSTESTTTVASGTTNVLFENAVNVSGGFGEYALAIIRIVIGLMGVLAVIMIVFGGIQYMISSSGGEKAGGKERMTNAIYGLLLALSSYLILNTINPNLVDLKITVPGGSLENSSNMFDNQLDGQDGYNTGATSTTNTFGNKVINIISGDTITTGDQTNLKTESLGSTLLHTNLDYSACIMGTSTTCVFKHPNDGDLPNIQINKNIATSLEAAFSDWRALKESDKVKYIYQISSMTGFDGTQAPGPNVLQSPHTFGLAFDIQPIPVSSELVTIFKNHGFAWGGEFPESGTIKKRPGHFSKMKGEGATGNDTYNYVSTP